MTIRVSVAVVGATGVVGEPLLAALEARKFPVGELFCLDEGEAVGEKVRHFGKSVTVASIAGFDFTRVQLVFFCSDATLASLHAYSASDAGCTVVDCSGAFADDPDVPLVVPGVNSEVLADFRQYPIIALPSSATLALLTVLKPLHEAAGIERVDLTLLEPVSVAGKAGIDELASQTVALLNMKDARQRVFPQQIAFNILPQLGAVTDNGYTDSEMRLVSETQKILPTEEIRLNPTVVLVPVFYGSAMTLHLECRSHLPVNEAMTLLANTPGVNLTENGAPSPVIDAAKGEGICVGRLREDISQTTALNLWITLDNVRKGAALSAVQIAELWVKCYT